MTTASWPAATAGQVPNSGAFYSAVAGGLGRYFDVDAVLFRVLFAVLSLFGGVGLAMYGMGWLLIPAPNTTSSGLDRLIGEVRRRGVPFGIAVAVALIVTWLAVFSWWAPGEVTTAVIASAVVIVALSRFRRQPVGTDEAVDPAAPVGLPATAEAPDGARGAGDAVRGQLRNWASNTTRRRRRARPILLATLVVAVLGAVALSVADAVNGIPVDAYLGVIGAILLAGLLIGILTRRASWSLLLPLLPIAAGLAVFGGSSASFHDGVGERVWAPPAAGSVEHAYRNGFGRTTLDLSQVAGLDAARTTTVRLGAGEVRLVLPRTLPVRVVGTLRAGDIEVDGRSIANGTRLEQTVLSPGALSNPAAPVLEIDVHLTAGDVVIDYV